VTGSRTIRSNGSLTARSTTYRCAWSTSESAHNADETYEGAVAASPRWRSSTCRRSPKAHFGVDPSFQVWGALKVTHRVVFVRAPLQSIGGHREAK
jgi:hypothetical protein